MNLSLTKFVDGVHRWTTEHAVELVIGAGVAAMGAAAVMTGKATIKAVRAVDKKKEEEQVDTLPASDVVKTVWKYYIPAVVTGVTGAVCVIGASKTTLKRNAVLATAYAGAETALREYQEKVVETIGEKKEQAVRESVNDDHIKRNPVSNAEVIITNRGDTLCFDKWGGRYFRCDIDKIRKVVNELNRTMLSDMYISLNDLYYEINLPPTQMGDALGWNIDRGLIDVYFSAHLTEDEEPCLAMDFKVRPEYNFSKLS